MIYLIGQLALWLFLTAAFMALVGWVIAAQRAAPEDLALRREREGILRDLMRLGDGPRSEGGADDDASRRLLEIRDGRIAELERALEAARSRADGAASELAELQRRIGANQADAEELSRLRALAAEREREIEIPAEPAVDENVVLQAWRLRYFEQRVKYLEGLSKAPSAGPEQVVASEPPLNEWRAREADARASYLENELRALRAPPAPEPAPESPFASDADMDALLRWRLLYMERRVAHLQGELARKPEPAPAPKPVVEAAHHPDPDLWKWRARYLEARVRHLETARAVIPVMAPVAQTPPPAQAAASARRTKPPALSAARNGAPDDFTLIEGVSSLQQTTLYSLGVFHFDQIAAWTPENVAWVDNYLRLQGRIDEQEWVEQADELARHGVAAARRVHESEDA
jgi:predicted flap endonuclease-1-like 5' DNA nuclease